MHKFTKSLTVMAAIALWTLLAPTSAIAPASAITPLHAEAENILEHCETTECPRISDVVYSADGKSVFAIAEFNITTNGKTMYSVTLAKYDLTTLAKTELIPAMGDTSPIEDWQPGETRTSTYASGLRVSADGKYLAYIFATDSQTLDYIDPKKGYIASNEVMKQEIMLFDLKTSKAQNVSSSFALSGAYVRSLSWSSSSKILNAVLEPSTSGLYGMSYNLATKKTTRSSFSNAISSTSRNGKFAALGVLVGQPWKFKDLTTGKSSSISNVSVQDKVIVLNDGKNMVAYVHQVGLCVFNRAGKRVVLIPQTDIFTNVLGFDLSKDEKSLIVVLGQDEFGMPADYGFSVIKIRLPK